MFIRWGGFPRSERCCCLVGGVGIRRAASISDGGRFHRDLRILRRGRAFARRLSPPLPHAGERVPASDAALLVPRRVFLLPRAPNL
ncbi:hypothetical protein PLICRDRAFT_47527 [Plicaturopsis crispa FD-325 SS-3]|uniref:Uncharacterized protein n=1 Tax=Plicaturopsis crispa FD-325 SS-3 TaxID=944288 RepID=A0A0C9SJV1_PLICR|nr:hypothetical protein PLICRDRAFT_47527 [Plicaturopsis crispa FD-325 SS-3]